MIISPKIIFITGASSGLGKALALSYARQGAILGLAARRENLLKLLAHECKSLGGIPYVFKLDVRNQAECRSTAEKFMEKAGGIDIVYANAGIGGGDAIINGDAAAVNNIISTNLLGVINTLTPFIPAMKNKRKGILVNISSAAAFMPLPFHGGYSASKAALRMLADSWRITLSKYNLQLTTICPGFIQTPMIEKNRYRIFLLQAPEAADKIKRAVERGVKTYVFPWQMAFLIPVLNLIPKRIVRWAVFKFKN
ncbi:MAG: SDR family NAD(P)-dependent oxidoreductase [Candidatus Neomarinimicrobiota bacterium]